MRKVRRAVITAAGMGTRFLPATKNLPKEMLPIVDTPIIHLIAQECVEAGIEDIVIVIRPGNEAVMNYFTPNKELEKMLERSGKEKHLERYKEVAEGANFVFVHQKSDLPYGNGSPILSVKNLIKDEPFVVCWGDDLFFNPQGDSGVRQVVEKFENTGDAYGVMGCQKMAREEMTRYGMVELSDKKTGKIGRIVEKPKLEEITSDLAEFGRMVLSPEIFNYLTPENTGKDGELWLMDSIEGLLQDKPVYAKEMVGEFLTTGDPLRFLKASFRYAMMREDLADDLSDFLRKELM